MNDIFDFRKKLVENYKRFSTSFASPRAADIAHAVQSAYDEGKFWPDPLIQINPNYRKASSMADLAAQGVVEPETAQIFQVGKQDVPPHPTTITLYNHSFRVLKEKELAEFGEYRTMRLVLEAFRKEDGV